MRTPGVIQKPRQGKKTRTLAAVVAMAALSCLLVSGYGCNSAAPQEEAENPNPEASIAAEKDSNYWASFVPKVITTEDGRQIQPTPLATAPEWFGMSTYSPDWQFYNTYVLDADHRGCSSCHNLKESLEVNMHHPDMYLGAYPSGEIGFASTSTCVTCHTIETVKTFAHGHMQWQTFREMGGSCLSCHFIEEDGSYSLWDDVKYDVMQGITPVEMSDSVMAVEYNQTEITPDEYMFTEAKYATGYQNDYVKRADDVMSTYTVSFGGEVANPATFTIQEMIDQFGSETRVETNHCVLEGAGENLIYQAEVTGIPLKPILEQVGATNPDAVATMSGIDGFANSVNVSALEDALLVYEMNGSPVSDDQGYPLALWLGGGRGAGTNVRFLNDISISSAIDEEAAHEEIKLDGSRGNIYVDGTFGEYINTPNIGVLTAASGQIFEAGKPVHLEGYSHAYVEPVLSIEFSLDGGETWKTIETPYMDPTNWIYWKMDLNLEPGAYTLQMRATSIDEDTGEPHSNFFQPKFLINVQ